MANCKMCVAGIHKSQRIVECSFGLTPLPTKGKRCENYKKKR
jgi:hypothetical protein